MTLCELLNQELPPEIKKDTSLTWVLFYLVGYATHWRWQDRKGCKWLLEDITDSTKTEVIYAQSDYK